MKTLSILSLSACLSVIAYNAYSLTCGEQPSCSDLGYTYSGSTSDCVGATLKCPFDTSKFYCTKKADVFSNMSLNWYSKETINPNTTYYPTKYGFVIVTALDKGNGEVSLRINGITFTGTHHEGGMQFYAVPVKPGDTIYVTSYNRSQDKAYFVPFKGN